MIGLGSNRLTVCRRGGMSVTQAGRGGMEWLAGGRMPSWASPYSAQATAALKAQFPTQWPTIRDYGFAHPEIVGYMNAYAPEDAKIAYSLVEGIGTRWIISSGNAYIDTGLVANDTRKFHAKFQFYAFDGAGAIVGNGTNWTFALRFHNNASSLGWFMTNGMYHKYSFDTYGVHEVELAKDYMKIDGEVINREIDSNSAISNNVFIYRCGAGYGRANIAYVEIGDSSYDNLRKMYPFIRKINGVDTCGMIDVLSGTFYQNAGSGSFTISETPAS